MIKKTATAIVVLLVAFLVFAATRPDSFRVQREAAIKAPPDEVFALLEDFHRWATWSPWEKVDPDMKRTYSGAASGLGAAYGWEGDRNIGKGSMEIVEAERPSRVRIRLDFLEPFEAHNTAEFTLRPEGDVTNVTWAMTGENTFMGKIIGIFVDMDTMIGEQFEIGLANMKTAAEG